MKYKGIRLVIAGSFSETYKRNALNNGFLCLEIPQLVNYLKLKFGKEKLTVKTEINAQIDFKNSVIGVDNQRFRISPVGEAAQELIVAGGLEEWVKKNL